MSTQPRNQKSSIITSIPGPKSRELRKKEDQFLAPGMQNFALLAGIVVDHASGSTVTDVDGNTFLDLIGGIGVNGLGHSHPKWVKAVKDQVERASVGSFTSTARVELLESLARNPVAPGVNRAQLYSSGAEAVESALRLAKSYTGKSEFVSFWGGFHGKTQGVLALMGSSFKDQFGPFAPGNHVVPFPDSYRKPFDVSDDQLVSACIEHARKQIKMNSGGGIAAIIVEPIQGTAGNIVPPKEFLPALKELAQEWDALLICDEMITGFGRTGSFWGSEISGVAPDIVTIGKNFGGGFPMSGLITSDEIANSKPWSNPSGSSSSYGGNPLACAAAAAAIKIVEEEGLVERSRNNGEFLLGKCQEMQEQYPFIGHVRGRGLMVGLELVKDRQTKEPMSRSVTEEIFKRCLKRGLLTMAYAPNFRLQPSLTIDQETLESGLEILKSVFDEVKSEKIWC